MDSKRILTIGGTVLIAATTGHIMQYGASISFHDGDEPASPVSVIETVAPKNVQSAVTPPKSNVPEINPSALAAPVSYVLDAHPLVVPEKETADDAPASLVADCEISITADELPNAMVALKIDAPCKANQGLSVAHSGMIFSGQVDPTGAYSVEMPALANEVVIDIDFDGGGHSRAETVVRMGSLFRSVLTWQGNEDIDLHVYENGAKFGGYGHVWIRANHTIDFKSDDIGSIIQLGDPSGSNSRFAQVYTHAQRAFGTPNKIEFVAEAEISAKSCGRPVSGTFFQIGGRFFQESIDINLTLPACDGTDGFLVLKNLVQDMKIASN